MRNDGGLGYYAPITYHRDERGYHYESDDYSIENMQLNDEELEAIRFAARTLVQYRNVPIFSQFDEAIGKIDDRLRLAPDMNTRELDTVVQFETAPTTKGSEHLMPLLQAIQGKCSLEIVHQKFQSNEASTYAVDPYLLREYRNRWYLIAWSADKEDFRTFGLDRITSLIVTEKCYVPRNDFDADAFFVHSFGISKMSGNPQDVIIHCNRLQYEYLVSQPVHPSQVLVQLDEDRYELKMHVLLTFELIQFILGLGSAVKVIAPEKLSAMLRSNLTETLRQYN